MLRPYQGNPMPHDPAYLLAEKKIEEALKSGTTELVIQYSCIRFAKQSVDNKGGKHGTR